MVEDKFDELLIATWFITFIQRLNQKTSQSNYVNCYDMLMWYK